jgi:hypothetical protein
MFRPGDCEAVGSLRLGSPAKVVDTPSFPDKICSTVTSCQIIRLDHEHLRRDVGLAWEMVHRGPPQGPLLIGIAR